MTGLSLADVIAVGYIACALACWPLIAGMEFAYFQCRYPSLAVKDRREDAGYAVIFGAVLCLFWPIGLPLAFCLSGFAEHGIWKSPSGGSEK